MNTCYNAIACTWITVTRVYTVNGTAIQYRNSAQYNRDTQLTRPQTRKLTHTHTPKCCL